MTGTVPAFFATIPAHNTTYSNQFSFVRAEQPQMLPLPRSYLMNHVRLL
jgi:hypothetical protein